MKLVILYLFNNFQHCRKQMQVLQRMNKKMDQGYKLTNYYCMFCNGVTLIQTDAKNSQNQVYCPKCDRSYLPQIDKDDQDQYSQILQQYRSQSKQNKMPQNNQQQKISINQFNKTQNRSEIKDTAQSQYNDFLQLYNSNVKTAQQQRSEQVSKKIGEKLINGWAMLQQSCLQCNVPLMRSKKGITVCVSCNKQFQNKKKNNNMQKVDQQSEIKQNVSLMNKQQKTENIKIQQKTQKNQKVLKKQQHIQNSQKTSSKSCQTVFSSQMQRIASKSLIFLQKKLDQSIENNDLEAFDKVIRSITQLKNIM